MNTTFRKYGLTIKKDNTRWQKDRTYKPIVMTAEENERMAEDRRKPIDIKMQMKIGETVSWHDIKKTARMNQIVTMKINGKVVRRKNIQESLKLIFMEECLKKDFYDEIIENSHLLDIRKDRKDTSHIQATLKARRDALTDEVDAGFEKRRLCFLLFM